ncbi:PDZ domain-containing protein [Anseongella ginsenosidimutans]|uniref:PDZ domain-containing protein n=1 Tax=Anseongella ginsenosidimutans TaxID=496056 RepID=A0A4R3KX85_9SPHI|nr:PDZ domain-containing protein [Anseongella ginsenosidimutans]QEC50933.1 PDZ domain-containing protein [Anseongella ginsenosidimutans]TCS90429.1 PDZ domain-containing protein [Anseongella ginsenosidimutans]
MKKITILIVIQFLFVSVYGQSAKEQLALANAAQLSNKNFYKEITFENRFGYFVIPVKIGNDVYQYIFDTGGYNTLTSEILEKNELPRLMEVQVGSSNQMKSKIAITKVPAVTINGIDFKDVGAFNFDFDASPQIKCYTNGGLIGKSIIGNAVWQINAAENKIILTDNIANLDNLDNALKIKVRVDKTLNPFIKVKINGKTESFLLDFGYGGFISLTEKDGKKYAAENVTEIIGEGAIGANGILQESTFVTALESFEISEIAIPNPIAYYSKSNNYNLIGTELTKYFIVTLNFQKSELYLTPLEGADSNGSGKSFGFDLNRNENTVYVSKIYNDLPADQAGLRVKDSVLTVNGQDINDYPYCDFYFYIRRLLREDKEICLEVKRSDEIKTLIIGKADLIIKP